MLSHGETPMCQIWYAYVSKDDLAQTQIHGENTIFDIDSQRSKSLEGHEWR